MMNKKQLNFLQALLTETTIAGASAKAGISRTTAYRYLSNANFQQELNKAKAECISDTIRYLQGNLTACSEELMQIIKRPDTADQVRINAINTVFANCKSLIDTYEVEERMQRIEEMLQEGVKNGN